MSDPKITRRDSLVTLGAASTGLALGGAWPRAAAAAPAPRNRQRVLRLAHLTDIHVQPELRAGDGMATCLHHVHELADKPDLIVFGGDAVMDSYDQGDARTALQWDLWHRVLANECSLPVRSCIGNHDIWGWNKSKSKTTGNEPLWGKKRALEMLHLDERYCTFQQAGWKFIVLDSTQPSPMDPNSYRAFIDEPQFDWLERTLAATAGTTPVLIVSHIPILSASAIFFSGNDNGGDFQVSGSLMHTDCIKLKNLFAQHPNVKVCMSGHLHLIDRVDYNGVTYLCNGAVSGNWWKGRHEDCDEGYVVVDLYDDGSFEHEYVTYGWRAIS